ncbi:glycosyltransferase family 2 protein [Microbacterium sp. SLBN-146]|uniref:glycosyltransferase family 2 protein n=1 Tax=Microbacterium sp. SLBN-146 TaxID=2768457 RepID=UPI0011511CBA|nr:glycosyltransferase family 2 protein [Microbacterium sp. SLBN-146]TQJ30606.1 GT2 family glycosyltransferase [Microbacterium sp. SLBN-146]
MTAPRIGICVVTYNSADLIEDLVASLAAGGDGTEWTLVVADNASSDDTVATVRRLAPSAIVIETGANLGYAAGVNAAIRGAGDQDAYLILNADVRLTAGCMATLYASLSDTVGIVVPRLLDAKNETIWSMRREPTVLRAWADAVAGAERVGRVPALGEIVTDPALYDSARPTDWAEGSTQLIGRACARACGDWDESYFLYSEETEYDLRARDNGFLTLYQPAAVAVHLEGGSAGSPRQWSLLVMNRVRLFARRRGPVAASAFWLATVGREASRAMLGKATSRAALRDLVSRRRWRERPGPEWLGGVRA